LALFSLNAQRGSDNSFETVGQRRESEVDCRGGAGARRDGYGFGSISNSPHHYGDRSAAKSLRGNRERVVPLVVAGGAELEGSDDDRGGGDRLPGFGGNSSGDDGRLSLRHHGHGYHRTSKRSNSGKYSLHWSS